MGSVGSHGAKVKAAVFCLSILFVASLFWLCRPAAKQNSASHASADAFPADLDRYAYALVFHPESSRLAVTMDLQMKNRSGTALEKIVLRTYAAAFASPETSPAAVGKFFDACYPGGFSPGDLLLHDTLWRGEAVGASFEDEARTVLSVSVPPLSPGEWGTLSLRCVLSVPDCRYRFGREGDVWLFGNCLPLLSRLEGGAWRQDPYAPIGDPFVSDCADYRVTLSLPEGYSCAATAPLEKGAGGGSSLLEGQVRAVRDFALAVFRGYERREGAAGEIRVISWAREGAAAGKALAFARAALLSFSARYGAYPWPAYTVLEAPFPFPGMEYPALSFIGSGQYAPGREDSLELAVAHETAHQWFYSLVGSDQFNQPWQDEALCEFAVLGYVLERHGRGAWENLSALRIDAPMRENVREGITPGSPVDAFGDYAEYASVVYGRGAAGMMAIDLDTGKLGAFLKEYVRRFGYRFASRVDFESLLNGFMGKDLSPLLSDYLDTAI